MPAEYAAWRNPYRNSRSLNSVRLLSAAQNWEFSTFTEKITDRFAYMASVDIPWVLQHFNEYTSRFPDKAAELKPLLNELKNWDKYNDVHSVASGIYSMMNFYGRFPDSIRKDSFFRFTALHKAKTYLQQKFDTWKVPLGDIQRHQRPPVSDSSESLPIPGGAGSVGSIFCFNNAEIPGQKRRYGRTGNGYVAAISFGYKIRAVSIVPFGNSSNPSSPHYFDQAPLYAQGKFKEAWFYKEDVLKHAKRTYHPGK